MGALDQQLWLSTIEAQLFKNDQVMNLVGRDHSGYVNNTTVHIPQAGSNPTISKDLNSFPAAIGSRTDADLTYNMNIYYSQPIRLGVDELQYISYDKRASVLDSHIRKMSNVITNQMLYKWAAAAAAAGSQVKTTGSAVPTALAPSATSTRLAIQFADFLSAAAILAGQNLNPSDNIYCIMPAALYYQIMRDTNISKFLEYGGPSSVAVNANVPMLAGMKILVRSSTVVYDNTSTGILKTVNDEGTPSSPAATDNLACLCVSESYVSKAKGALNVYTRNNDPSYYGDILSVTQVFGASQMRTNGEGVVSIIQAN